MKVVVNKCPHSGLLFEDDKEYRKHMREIQKRLRHDRERVEFARQFDEFMAPLYQLTTFEEIQAWLNENYWLIARHHGYECHRWGRRHENKRPGPDDKVNISFQFMKVDPEIPTSHNAPLGQPTSWHERRCETGWRGRIEIKFEGEAYEFFRSDQLRSIGINTGSGGGGPKALRYDCYLFSKDFKKMAALEVYKKMASHPVK